MDDVTIRANAAARDQMLELQRIRDRGVELACEQTIAALRVQYQSQPWLRCEK